MRSLYVALLLGGLINVIPHSARSESPPLKIGVMLCLSGACAEVGSNSLNGIRLAQEEINATGGVLGRKIELVVQDTREMDSPKNAVSAYQSLRLDKEISLIIGPTWSVGGMPLAPIISKDPAVIVTSPSVGVEAFNETSDNIFNLWPHDSVATRALARYAIDQKWNHVAVLSNQFPWESSLAKVFREEYQRLGGKESVFIELTGTETDLRSSVARIKKAQPDALFMTNYTQLGLTGRTLRDLQLAVPMMTVLLEATQIALANGSLEGVLFAEYHSPAADFQERYKAKFKLAAGMSSDTGYDTLMVYRRAIETAQSLDHQVMIDTLLKTRYSGASGEVVFDSKGGVIKEPVIKFLQGNQHQVAETSKK